MKESKTFNNTLYCIKYIWKIDKQYILLMITISVLTSIFNVINLSILRYITNTLMKKETGYFLGIIGIMFLLSTLDYTLQMEDQTKYSSMQTAFDYGAGRVPILLAASGFPPVPAPLPPSASQTDARTGFHLPCRYTGSGTYRQSPGSLLPAAPVPRR